MQTRRIYDTVVFDTQLNTCENGSYKSKYSFDMLSEVFSGSALKKEYRIKLAGGAIPNTAFNTNESNNKVSYTVGASSGTLAITPGSYNANTFLSSLATAFADDGVSVSGSYSSIRQRYSLTNNEVAELTIDLTAADSAFAQLGLLKETYAYPSTTAVESVNVANVTATESSFNIFLAGTHNHITKNSEQVSSTLLWSLSPATIQPMAFIPLPSSAENIFLSYLGNRRTELEIRDSDGFLVNFQGVNFTMKFLIEELSWEDESKNQDSHNHLE